MTEAEWLACSDLPRLIKSQKAVGKARKLRLFACACARRVWDQLAGDSARSAVEASERFADCAVGEADLAESHQATQRAWGQASMAWASILSTGLAVVLPDASHAALHASTHAPAVRVSSGTPSRKTLLAAERQTQRDLFRDVFGNPFRPATFDDAWRTSTAVALAKGMYESRDFGAMPILADALQDAGCNNDDMLDHCRGDGPHVRGCWVVDLVLGKE